MYVGIRAGSPVPLNPATEGSKWMVRYLFLTLLGVVPAILYGLSFTQFSSLGQYLPDFCIRERRNDDVVAAYRKSCPKHRFESVQILSRDPTIVLIEEFLTKTEAEVLLRIA
jgi:hypothetical protein